MNPFIAACDKALVVEEEIDFVTDGDGDVNGDDGGGTDTCDGMLYIGGIDAIFGNDCWGIPAIIP